jgi:hypothetical protein
MRLLFTSKFTVCSLRGAKAENSWQRCYYTLVVTANDLRPDLQGLFSLETLHNLMMDTKIRNSPKNCYFTLFLAFFCPPSKLTVVKLGVSSHKDSLRSGKYGPFHVENKTACKILPLFQCNEKMCVAFFPSSVKTNI